MVWHPRRRRPQKCCRCHRCLDPKNLRTCTRGAELSSESDVATRGVHAQQHRQHLSWISLSVDAHYPIADLQLTGHELPHARRPAPLVHYLVQVSRNSNYPHSSRLAIQGQSKAQLFIQSSPNGNVEFCVHGTNTGSACRLNSQRTADCSGFLKGP